MKCSRGGTGTVQKKENRKTGGTKYGENRRDRLSGFCTVDYQ